MDNNAIIMRPVITEKSMARAGAGKFTFIVARKTNKTAIKQAIESQFGVHVMHVSTTIVKGKTQRVGQKRLEIPVSVYKKAVVTLEKGQKIGLFELGE